MRDVTEAHFLHQRQGLEPVFRPPVQYPTAMAWIPGREELVACSRDGSMHIIDPVLGTRVAHKDLGEVNVLSIHPDRKRWMGLTRDGEWMVGRFGAGIEHRGKTGFVGGLEGFWVGEFAVYVGDTAEQKKVDGVVEQVRELVILQDGVQKARIEVPARVVPLPGENNKLLLARSNQAGLEVVKFGKEIKFADIPSTQHRLKPCGAHVLGFTATGVAIWSRAGGSPRSMRLPDLTTGDINTSGAFLGLGTRTGAVALAIVNKLDARARPHLVKAFDQPVSALAFSDRGRWLATGAESLQVWTWEDAED